jgi:hypothetical protein
VAIQGTTRRTELDHRSDQYADVTFVWVNGAGVDETFVCVRTKEDEAYFEIATKPYLAFDVFNHPFVYRDFGVVVADPALLAA